MSVARLLPISLALVVIGCGSGADRTSRTPPSGAPSMKAAGERSPTRAAARSAAAQAASTRVSIPSGPGALAVMAPKDGLTLRNRPNGKVIAHLRPTTEWDSPTVVWAVQRRGNWVGVIATAIGNNKIGWIDLRRERPRMWRSTLRLEADLSNRTLVVKRGGRTIRRMPVGIGGPTSPTPTGRFTVTDKLIPAPSQSYYGCCVLALSGHQPNPRPGWAGGDRIAIHGGGKVGLAASAGCLRAPDAVLRRLMKVLPVGTPVVIRA